MASRSEQCAFYDPDVFLSAAHDDNGRRMRWVVVLSAAMMLAEVVAGWVYHSMALLADGIHMATHVAALGISAAAYAFARAHARDARYSFGTGKVGDLAAFASALVLGAAGVAIVVESVDRLMHPGLVAYGDALIVATLGLLVNCASAALLSGGHHHGEHGHAHGHHHEHGHDHHHDHHHAQDNNFRSAYIHVLADALTSALAVAALLAGRYLGWSWLDPIVGVIGAAVIAQWAWKLIRDASAVLLDTRDPELEAEIRNVVERQGGSIADLHVWRVGPGAHAAIISVIGGPLEAQGCKAALLALRSVKHVTVEHGAVTATGV